MQLTKIVTGTEQPNGSRDRAAALDSDFECFSCGSPPLLSGLARSKDAGVQDRASIEISGADLCA